MNEKLTRRCDLVDSGDFSVCLEAIQGTIQPIGSEHKIPFTLSVAWDAAQRLIVTARREDALPEAELDLKTPVAIEGVVEDAILRGWCLSCPKMHIVEKTTQHGLGSKRTSSTTLLLNQWDQLILRRGSANVPIRTTVFWVINFLFQGERETATRENASRLDGFRFSWQGYSMTMRQVEDYKEVEKRLRKRGATRLVTSVLQVANDGSRTADPVADAAVDGLFSLISGMYGLWTKPEVRCDYDEDDSLAAISFRLRPAHTFHQARCFVDYDRTGHGWGHFLQEMCAGFSQNRPPDMAFLLS